MKSKSGNRQIKKSVKPFSPVSDNTDHRVPDWQFTVNAMSDIVMIMDLECNIIAINEAALNFLNSTYENSIGKNYLHLMYGDTEPPEECTVCIYLKTGKEADNEIFLTDKKIWVSLVTRPIYNSNKEVIAIFHVIRDISNFKQASENMKTFHDFGLSLSEVAGLRDTLSLCLDIAIEVSGMDSGGIYTVDVRNGDLKLVTNKGVSADFIRKTSSYIANTPQANLVMNGAPVYATNIHLNAKMDITIAHEGLKFMAMLPVIQKDTVIGCLSVASHTATDMSYTSRIAIESILPHVRGTLLRLQAEEDLISSEEKYRSIVENANEAIIIAQQKMVKLANPAAQKLFGYTAEELLKKEFIKLIHPDDRQMAMEHYFARRVKGKYPDIFTLRGITKSGTVKFIELNVVQNDWEGRYAAINLIRDITDITRASDAVRESEAKYRLMAENIDDVIFTRPRTLDRYTFISSSVEKMLGYTADEIMYMPTSQYIAPESLKNINEKFSKLAKRGYKKDDVIRYEAEHIHKNGNRIWVETVIRPLFDDNGEFQGLTGVSRDITERKNMEQELLDSEEKYRTIFENSPIPLWEQDFTKVKKYIDSFRKNGVTDLREYFKKHPHKIKKCIEKIENLNINQATFDLLKLQNEKSFIKNIDKLLMKETYESILENFISFSEGNFSVKQKTRQRTFDKQVITLESSISIVPGHENEWSKALLSLIDITELVKSEKALKESERKFRDLFQNANDAIVYMSVSGELIEVNRATAELFGGTVEELRGKHFSQLGFFNGAELTKYLDFFKRILQNDVEPITVNLRNKQGKQLTLESSTALVKSGKKINGILIVTRDITERVKLEEQRQQTARLESIGTLAGGIAHDFNNLLTGIMGNIGLVKMNQKRHEEAFQMLDEAEKASIRAKNLTQQLLTFARGGQPVKKPFEIGNILKELTEFALRGSHVKPVFEIPDNLWIVEADEAQITQVITNLVINAHDSMPEGGIINVKARNRLISAKDKIPLHNGKYVELMFTDHGTGIKAEHLTRIFEPYFTTKQKGSGLGLATVYSIINNHNGHIFVESTQGRGSTFHVFLPTTEKESAIPTHTKVEKHIPGKGKIMVMDDNELIRELAPRMLAIAGYEVDTAADGKEAIKKYNKALKTKKPFDVIIMDLTIPGGMGGKEAIKHLRKLDKKVKVIVSSGYANDPIMANYKRYGFNAVVSKPYSAIEMQQVLQELLKQKK